MIPRPRVPDALRRRLTLALVTALLPLSLSACRTQQVGLERPAGSGMAPMLTVERFLQAANARELGTMARLFGTEDGPIAETGSTFGCFFKKIGSWIALGDDCASWQEVELRMNAIAQILRHDDFRAVSESAVAGRRYPTTRIGVTLVRGNRSYQDVPFEVVRSDEGVWLIERIGLERITSGSR